MSTIETNIVPFPHTRKSEGGSKGVGSNVAHIVSLCATPKLAIYWERDTGKYPHIGDFFKTLLLVGEVTIIHDHEVSEQSLLRIVHEDMGELEIPAQEFIQMTKKNPGQPIVDYSNYLYQVFDSLAIKISFHHEDQYPDFVNNTLTEKELNTYKPEEITIYENGSYEYVCSIHCEESEDCGYSDHHSFADIHDVHLLDLIIIALGDAEIRDFYEKKIHIEITYYEGDNTSITTTIPPLLVTEVISGALYRINPLYKSLSLEKALKHYFGARIAKKLS